MALVYGRQSAASVWTELEGGAGAGTGAGAGEDSDDEEYVYVSRLAEQIAAHAMLDEEDDRPPTRPQPIMHCNEASFSSYAQEVKLQNSGLMQDVDYPVSRFAAVWRDHGPTEWECFYTPSLQPEISKHASILNSQLDQIHKLRGWTSLCHANTKQAGPHAHETWEMPSHCKSQPFLHGSPLLKRKESIGTGVFLPKIVSTGSHYRRKAGLSSKPAHAPRSKS